MNTATYAIAGMTCQGCVRRVQAALAPLAQSVTVSLDPPQAVLTAPVANADQIKLALAGSHYSVIDAAPLPKPVAVQPAKTWLSTYQPLLILISLIALCSVAIQIPSGKISPAETMRFFMAGFFLAFSFFKLLDIAGFARAYAGYDLIAQRWLGWGLLYPFIELALGLAYLTHWQPTLTNAVTVIVMGISAIGVIRAVVNKKAIRCACLGSVFQLPMSTVTIVEDLAMMSMAAAMFM